MKWTLEDLGEELHIVPQDKKPHRTLVTCRCQPVMEMRNKIPIIIHNEL